MQAERDVGRQGSLSGERRDQVPLPSSSAVSQLVLLPLTRLKNHSPSTPPPVMPAPARPPPGPLGATDPSRWRLDSSNDRHLWFYDRVPGSTAYEQVWGQDSAEFRAQEQNDETKYWTGLPLPPSETNLVDPQGNPYESARKGYEFYKRIQSSDGHWSGEYGGERARFTVVQVEGASASQALSIVLSRVELTDTTYLVQDHSSCYRESSSRCT